MVNVIVDVSKIIIGIGIATGIIVLATKVTPAGAENVLANAAPEMKAAFAVEPTPVNMPV